MKFQNRLFLLAIAAAVVFASGCATGGVSAIHAPSLSARLVQKWAFADFAREVEGRSPKVHISSAVVRPSGTPVVLVPVQTIGGEAFAEMKQLSQPGDDISEFVDTSDGRYFFCLIRGGQIVKTYEFENRASRV